MQETAEAEGALHTTGEAVGGFISKIPGAISSFFGGVGEGAGVHGTFDWIALILGVALLASVYRGFKRGRIVGPMLSGLIGITLMGWAVS